jgi:hypothetical protein
MINVKGVASVAALFCVLLLFRMARQKWWAFRHRWQQRRKQ